MENKRFTVVLTGRNGRAFALKFSRNSGEENTLIVHAKNAVCKGDGTLYLIADEIAKTIVNRKDYEYKVPFSSKNDFVCVYKTADETYIGCTGKTPSAGAVEKRISAYEKSLEKTGKEIESEREDEPEIASEIVAEEAEIASEEKDETQSDFSVEINSTETEEDEEECAREEREIEEEPLIIEKKKTTAESRNPFVFDDGVRYDGTNFYLAVKPQLDELFVCYPPEKELNDLVPSSKWVHVDADGDYYVVGLIYDSSAVAYICYGIPFSRYSAPPEELLDVSVWLPVDRNDESGRGYWVIYQSATDGKCLR